jgi:amino acid synthesis protein
MIEIRKIVTTRETVFSELGVEAARSITRAVGMAVIRNPFAGQFVEDLRPLFEAGAMLGERLMPELVKLLDGPAVSYGKGAIVGVGGEMEHGGACVHPMLRKPVRADRRREGGDRIERQGGRCGALCSTCRSGTRTIPGRSRTSIRSRSQWPMPLDPRMMLVVMAIADGGRLRNRCGTEPIR